MNDLLKTVLEFIREFKVSNNKSQGNIIDIYMRRCWLYLQKSEFSDSINMFKYFDAFKNGANSSQGISYFEFD